MLLSPSEYERIMIVGSDGPTFTKLLYIFIYAEKIEKHLNQEIKPEIEPGQIIRKLRNNQIALLHHRL